MAVAREIKQHPSRCATASGIIDDLACPLCYAYWRRIAASAPVAKNNIDEQNKAGASNMAGAALSRTHHGRIWRGSNTQHGILFRLAFSTRTWRSASA